MADDSVVDNDESKIVTQFIFDTCRLNQPRLQQVMAARTIEHMGQKWCDDRDNDLIALITGSAAEFYIEPMLSCFGDVDIMFHFNTALAIPAGDPPPSRLPAEFHSDVMVCEIIDSGYPGYVYLIRTYELTENADTDKYDAVHSDRRHFVSIKLSYGSLSKSKINGPAYTTPGKPGTVIGLSIDMVPCVRCVAWPIQGANWPTRYRNYGWPDSATVDRVVSNGCDVVQVAQIVCVEKMNG